MQGFGAVSQNQGFGAVSHLPLRTRYGYWFYLKKMLGVCLKKDTNQLIFVLALTFFQACSNGVF